MVQVHYDEGMAIRTDLESWPNERFELLHRDFRRQSEPQKRAASDLGDVLVTPVAHNDHAEATIRREPDIGRRVIEGTVLVDDGQRSGPHFPRLRLQEARRVGGNRL